MTQVPIYHTHVEYTRGDKLGYILALFSLLPIAILISYATLILFNRHAVMFFALIGQLLNEALNSILKHAIAIPRPNLEKGRGYGFPSSHAQFMGYTLVFLTLCFRGDSNSR
jgi:dolichyldiphosphatase